jgi:septal ring factor EnvC (AmiA/AmiB activator)
MRDAVDQTRIDGLKQEIASLKRDLEASNIKLEKFRRELATVRWDMYNEKKQCLASN